MIDNPTLRAIRDRRSVRNFTSDPVDPGHLDAILEAARWAPSGRNSQPWDLVVVKDDAIRSALGAALKRITFSWGGLSNAPVLIVVSVNTPKDPEHFVEDGAVAAQNMCLAAQSLGLGSSWAGVYSHDTNRNSVERSIANLVGLPKTHRVIAVVPIGIGRPAKATARRPLEEIVHYDRYTSREDSRNDARDEKQSGADLVSKGIPKIGRRRRLTEPGRFV